MFGMDYLGLGSKKWPVDMTIKETPKGWAIGCFDGTMGDSAFGDCIPALKKFMASGKFPAVRVQMWYNTGHTLVPMDQLTKRLPLYEKLAKAFPAVKVYISHSCEYNDKSVKAVQERVNAIKKLCPSCVPVNTIWQGATLPGVITEAHNPGQRGTPPYTFSFDGGSCVSSDIERVKKIHGKAEIFFFWDALFNLRESGDAPAPNKRTSVPSAEYIRSIVRIASPCGKAPAPSFKGKVLPVKKPLLWKVFAEDSPGPDPRGNKPLFISNINKPSISVVAANGKEVGKLKFYGNYTPGLWRYYSGSATNLWGYQLGLRASKAAGSEFVWLTFDNKTFYGPINPSFRVGYFQK